jgi:hypothetical protein
MSESKNNFIGVGQPFEGLKVLKDMDGEVF